MKSVYEVIEGYLNKLPSPYKEQALRNFKELKPTPFSSTHHIGSIREAVDYAFAWSNSPEGYQYWNSLWVRLSDDQYFHNNIDKK